ncbi:hypothetical protein [Bdellovibrio sp. NC01]|uniref:hypothetical protein n=1 Tax=Bdellovibrio sp. NC01 TaxID=2220073 RepID=UPI001157956C|nr:hypothetical protein [Bdellovibrio sp. NC01]QDK36192.1 hypothetical protein DOE51_00535 [Bdellovibrio sp. NC01]
MKAATIIITAAVMTISSTSFAGSKCKHMMSSQGNSLFAHTVAPSSNTQGTTTTATAATSNQAIK